MALDTKTDFVVTLDDQAKARQAKKEKAAEQARINGSKSHGPSSNEGKRISSRNAIRHGLTANEHTLLATEDPAQYTEVYDAFVASLRPGDKAELRLVEKIANLDWRLERLAMMETAILNMGAATTFEDIYTRWERIDGIGIIVEGWMESCRDATHCLSLLQRYMGTLQSQFNSNLKNFRNLEKHRLARKANGTDLDELHRPYRAPNFDTLPPPEPVEPPKPERTTQPNEINNLPLRPAA